MSSRYPQLAREPLLTSRNRPNPSNRFWAKVVDVGLVEFCSWVAYLLVGFSGWLLVPVLMLSTMESLGRGQSPGKWLLGLHAIEGKRGRKIGWLTGLQRNFPFIVLCWSLPLQSLFQVLLFFCAACWLAVEAYFVFFFEKWSSSG